MIKLQLDVVPGQKFCPPDTTSLLGPEHSPISKVVQKVFLSEDADFGSLEQAMIQAFYSRSTLSIEDRLGSCGATAEDVRKKLRQFYIGYGHKSIGQCATKTLFFENISILAAKCIQNNALYNGQECSTRYLDFSERDFIDPLNLGIGKDLAKFYHFIKEACVKAIPATLSVGTEITQTSLNARAFDIARFALTAGFTTQVSWSSTFDNIQEHLTWLRSCPVPEVQDLAFATSKRLAEEFPDAFSFPLLDASYQKELELAFFDSTERLSALIKNDPHTKSATLGDLEDKDAEVQTNFDYLFSSLIPEAVSQNDPLLRTRTKYAPLPRNASVNGTFTFTTDLDYASFRDLQRHRSGLCLFPAYSLDKIHDLHPWYMQQLCYLGIMDLKLPPLPSLYSGVSSLTVGEMLWEISHTLLPCIAHHIKKTVPSSKWEAVFMYYVPMGCTLPTVFRYDLPQAVYVSELRTGETVHPTVRIAAKCLAKAVQKTFPDMPLYVNMSSDKGPSVKRGTQTITEKPCETETLEKVYAFPIFSNGYSLCVTIYVRSNGTELFRRSNSSLHWSEQDSKAQATQQLINSILDKPFKVLWSPCKPEVLSNHTYSLEVETANGV